MVLNCLILGREEKKKVMHLVSPDPRCSAVRRGLSSQPTQGDSGKLGAASEHEGALRSGFLFREVPPACMSFSTVQKIFLIIKGLA